MNNSKLIYSTGYIGSDNKQIDNFENVAPENQKIRLHLDRKGGGKIVTVIKGFQEKNESLSHLSKIIKKYCGSGGTIKNNHILIQGNHREKIKLLLSEKGYEVKLSGG
tara:strand:- start:108 stop:431 length:324 start_codon:yes stop_codon:yes gene_type:complete